MPTLLAVLEFIREVCTSYILQTTYSTAQHSTVQYSNYRVQDVRNGECEGGDSAFRILAAYPYREQRWSVNSNTGSGAGSVRRWMAIPMGKTTDIH